MHSEPGFNDTWGLFWRAHPGPEEGVFTPDLFTDAHLALLRTPELVGRRAGWGGMDSLGRDD